LIQIEFWAQKCCCESTSTSVFLKEEKEDDNEEKEKMEIKFPVEINPNKSCHDTLDTDNRNGKWST
jgi:hypothetical protein